MGDGALDWRGPLKSSHSSNDLGVVQGCRAKTGEWIWRILHWRGSVYSTVVLKGGWTDGEFELHLPIRGTLPCTPC